MTCAKNSQISGSANIYNMVSCTGCVVMTVYLMFGVLTDPLMSPFHALAWLHGGNQHFLAREKLTLLPLQTAGFNKHPGKISRGSCFLRSWKCCCESSRNLLLCPLSLTLWCAFISVRNIVSHSLLSIWEQYRCLAGTNMRHRRTLWDSASMIFGSIKGELATSSYHPSGCTDFFVNGKKDTKIMHLFVIRVFLT